MLTPPNWCISVALCVNPATCCIDTSENQSWYRRVLGSIEYFWRKASTNRQGTTLAPSATRIDAYADPWVAHSKTQFGCAALPRVGDQYVSHQLIRNVLAAHALKMAFCVLLDGRRPDLMEAWYAIMKCVRIPELGTRCKVLTWQELSGTVPPDLRQFLDSKYGIVPTGCDPCKLATPDL
jgi:hypothetical protein